MAALDPSPSPARPSAAVALLAALTGAAGYAAFAGGAVHQQDAAWLEVGLALAALVAAAAWLRPRTLRPSASPLALAGLAALALYVGWVGASLTWTVAPSGTWAELNRTLAYVLVVALAIAGASTAPRAIERIAIGWLAIATVVALYALGGKVFPGVFDHAAETVRLRAPFDDPDALGLACALAAPIALRVAVQRSLSTAWRLAALISLLVLLCTLGMTWSRSGVLALVVTLVVLTVQRGPRLAGLAAAALALVAAAPVLAVAFSEPALSEPGVGLARRIDAGLLFGLIVASAAALLVIAGRVLIGLERKVPWTPARGVRTWAVLGGIAVALAGAGVALLATSDDGLRGAIDRAADEFTATPAKAEEQPSRLLSTTSENRSAWWEEAFGAWADKPTRGWGAESFGVTHRLYRSTPVDTSDAHSMPLGILQGTGVIGALLVLGGLLALGVAAALQLRRLPAGRERDVAGALLAAAAAWGVHALLDRDWSVPGVTVPALLFLGVLVARRPAPEPPRSAVGVPREESSAPRFVALAAACLLLIAAMGSAVLPAWSDAKTDKVSAQARSDDEQTLEDAAAAAELAARLDPVAIRPLFVAADIALRRGRALEVRQHLLEAVDRQPWSVEAWMKLARVARGLADRDGARQAVRRAATLDPGNPEVVKFARYVDGSAAAPPETSGTAVGTPLLP